MRLWLVRHAQPLIAPGICYGRLDMAADAAASNGCARQLALELPAGLRVRASPLQRCAQLAQSLHRLRPDLAHATDARLQEMDFGHWEGRAWQAIAPAELQAWTDDFAHHAVGRTGESVAAFMARVGSAYDELVSPQAQSVGRPASAKNPLDGLDMTPGADDKAPARSKPSHSGTQPGTGSDMLWITHAGVIRAVGLLAQGLRHIERAEQWPLDAPKYGQWRTLDLHIDPAHPRKPCASTG